MQRACWLHAMHGICLHCRRGIGFAMYTSMYTYSQFACLNIKYSKYLHMIYMLKSLQWHYSEKMKSVFQKLTYTLKKKVSQRCHRRTILVPQRTYQRTILNFQECTNNKNLFKKLAITQHKESSTSTNLIRFHWLLGTTYKTTTSSESDYEFSRNYEFTPNLWLIHIL